MTRPFVLVASLLAVVLGNVRPASADVIQLFRDRVQLAAQAEYRDPLTGALYRRDASFDGPSSTHRSEAVAAFPDGVAGQQGNASFVPRTSPNGNGFSLAAWSYPGDCLFNQPCPTEQSQSAAGRFDWMFHVLGSSTLATLEMDAFNSTREMTRLSLYDLTADMFVADYFASDDPVQSGEFALTMGHSYRLFGSAAVPSAWGDPFSQVRFTTNADINPPAVPEPATLLLLGSGAAALAARRRSQNKKANPSAQA